MLRVIELFAGIGSQHQALKNIGIEHNVVAIAEIDKYALLAYKELHGEVLNLGDITKVEESNIPDCDLITYSFPCQDISIAGLQAGVAENAITRSSLLWQVRKFILAKRPKYLLLENVKNLIGKTHKANFDKWLEFLEKQGYRSYWKVLNTKDYGLPQNRERVFVVSILGDDAFTFPEPQPLTKSLASVLDREVADNAWLDIKYKLRTPKSKTGILHIADLDIRGNDSIRRVYDIRGISPTLTTMKGGNRQPKIMIDSRVRKLTPRECWNLQGFAGQFDLVKGKLSNTQLYAQAGNTISVPVLEAIFKQLFQEVK